MKRIINALFAGLVILSLMNTSCNKIDGTYTTPPTPPRPTPLPQPPLPPPAVPPYALVNANMNITIELPMNFAILNGHVNGLGWNGATVKWEKITGPASYLLVSPDSVKTKVTNLEKGVYTFKLSATKSGQTLTDTMTLIVQDATSTNKQIFFWSLNWSCPMGCSIALEDALSYLPSNSLFALYIRSEFSSNWELVVPESNWSTARYVYSVWPGQLSVFETSGIDATDHPEIKIVF